MTETPYLMAIIGTACAAFFIGRLRQKKLRRAVLAVLLLAPAMALFITLAMAKPSESGTLLGWFLIGLIMMGLPYVVGIALSLVAYRLGNKWQTDT